MTRTIYFAFSAFSYALFFATFLYLIAFVGDFPIASRTVERGGQSPLLEALAINFALIAVFGIQHSVMARAGFKRAWMRIVPPPIERSTYVMVASLALILLFVFWRPIPGNVWLVENPLGTGILWGLFASGWGIVLLSTFLLNHFELFGLQQVYFHAKGRAAERPRLRQLLFYKFVRHPLYTGFFIAFWATPNMSYGHFMLAVGMSAYMLFAIRYEERDLVAVFGREYEAYQKSVGMLTPHIRTRAE